MVRPTWHEYFMFIAKVVSTRSTCNSRPTGAVIVKDRRILATGYNGSMPGSPHCSDFGPRFCFRREKEVSESNKFGFCRASHAEANAIVQAARLGIPVEGASIYCTLQPCYTCLKLIVGAGIKEIYYELEYKSKDRERDRFWLSEVQELIRRGQLRVSKLQISEEICDFVYDQVKGFTSRRRFL